MALVLEVSQVTCRDRVANGMMKLRRELERTV
jgi:hypothetical protein